MKAIVIGASGATGRFLVEELLNSATYSLVTVFVRKPSFEAHPKLKQIVVDFEKLADFSEHLQGDVAFSCLGTTLKAAGSKKAQWKIDYDYQYDFAQLTKQNGVPVFILVSAINAKASSSIFYSKMKGQLENAIIDLKFDKTIIFQPSILERPNTDRSGEKFALSVMKGISTLGLLKNHRPTHVQNLAISMVRSVENSSLGVNYFKVSNMP